MTYGNPAICAGPFQSFAQAGVEKLLVLPLYPQYCSSTTGSVIDGPIVRSRVGCFTRGPLHQRLP